MKQSIYFLCAVFVFSMTSCSTGAAEKTISQFHKHMDAGEFELICNNLLSQEALDHSSKAQWLDLFKTIDGWGERKNRQQKSGFSSKINNGIKTVKLKYTFEIDTLVFYENFVISNRDGTEKISVYAVNTDESAADRYTEAY